jgi:hypothetical protein
MKYFLDKLLQNHYLKLSYIPHLYFHSYEAYISKSHLLYDGPFHLFHCIAPLEKYGVGIDPQSILVVSAIEGTHPVFIFSRKKLNIL